MFLSVCLSLCVTIAFSGNNQISQPHLVALCSFQKKINSLFLAKEFSAFPLPPQDSLPPIGLNWKVMKFLFKEMIDVYKNDLAGEKHGCCISVWFYAKVESLHCFKQDASSPFTVLLYEITWLLYQLYHLGPVTSATDEPA